MKKQALAIAIASALAAPSAFAAVDTSGMQYTSAAEGFYASIRTQLNFGEGDKDAVVDNAFSRIGIRGTNDLGGGLEGFYTWELGVNINNGDSAGNTRLGHVGLRGGFGQIQVGSFWTQDYNWVGGSTDQANVGSGNFVSGRQSSGIEYTTPDLNGFQGAFRVQMNGGDDSNGNDLDQWNLAAQYAIQGFTVAGSYNVITDGQTTVDGVAPREAEAAVAARCLNAAGDGFVDGTDDHDNDANTYLRCATNQGAQVEAGTDAVTQVLAADAVTEQKADLTSWTVRLGYAQDNWYVNGWYGEDDTDEVDGQEAVETFSVAAGVAVDKVNLYAIYETRDNVGGANGVENSYGTVGAQYNLGAQSRVWLEYEARENDGNSAVEDRINIGLRHDF